MLAGNSVDESKLAATASSLARFLMAGLRLPSPTDFETRPLQATPETIDVPLYPLYELTGQQWQTWDDPSTDDWVELNPNSSPEARHFFSSVVKAVNGSAEEPNYRFNLTQSEVDLIKSFRGALDTVSIDVLVQSRYPALQQVAVERALGTATPWAKPGPVTFLDSNGDATGEQNLVLLAAPRSLREALPRPRDPDRRLKIRESIPDPVAGRTRWQALENTGWATRLEIQVRRVLASDGDADVMPATYEVLSATAQTQADLVGLRHYLEDNPEIADGDIEIEILFPSGPRSTTSDAMRSDELTTEDRQLVSLLKSNLSTFSRPSTIVEAEATPKQPVAAATLAEPRHLLELLWQVSVTNAGGFFMHYGVPAGGPGFPDELFEDSETATISILAIVRQKDSAKTVHGMRFHNVLVCAQNLASDTSTVIVTAERHTVTELKKPAGETQSLQQIADSYGTTASEVAILNASTENLLKTGVPVTYKPATGEQRKYSTVIGDDLLTVALALKIDVGELGTIQADNSKWLHKGALLEVYPEWVAERNRVEQQLGGFRVLRKEPPGVESGDAPVNARIERLFNLLGYSLQENEYFFGSSEGLPISPSEPDDTAKNGLFARCYRRNAAVDLFPPTAGGQCGKSAARRITLPAGPVCRSDEAGVDTDAVPRCLRQRLSRETPRCREMATTLSGFITAGACMAVGHHRLRRRAP